MNYPWERFRSTLIPDPGITSLVRALVCEGEEARSAFRDLCRCTEGSQQKLANFSPLARRFLPLLYLNLTEHAADLPDGLRQYLKIAFARDALRQKTFLRILREIVSALHALGVSFVLTGGTASLNAYPRCFRHCHDIDLFVEDMEEISRVLAVSSLPGLHFIQRYENTLVTRHQTGMEVNFHRSLFKGGNRSGAEIQELTGRPIHFEDLRFDAPLFPAEFNLLSVLGNASRVPARDPLKWTCDALFILRANPGIDPGRLDRLARQYGVQYPLRLMTAYLAERFKVPTTDHLKKLPLAASFWGFARFLRQEYLSVIR